MYVREGVYKRLVKAAQLLQKIKPGYKIVILDAWRPPKVQESLFNKYYTELWERNVKSGAGLTPAEIYEKTQQFVSVPSLDKKKPSPHFTGGAVDITYADERGNWSTMGTGFDDFTEKALNDYLERKQTKSKLNETEKEALENRRILYAVMKEAGFVSYREEWWHYDFGNQFAAEVARANGINMVAKYGLVKDLSNVKDIKEESVKTSRTDEPKRQKFFSELSR